MQDHGKQVASTFYNHYEGHGRGHHLLELGVRSLENQYEHSSSVPKHWLLTPKALSTVQLLFLFPYEGTCLNKAPHSVASYSNFEPLYFKATFLISPFQFTLWWPSECYSPPRKRKKCRIISNVWVPVLDNNIKSKIPLGHVYEQRVSKSHNIVT